MKKVISKGGVSKRDRKIIRDRVNGHSLSQIGERVGMTKASIFFCLKRLQPELKAALERANYGLNEAVTKMVEMTEAKKTEFFASNGIVLDSREVADNQTRLQARREMLRVHGVGDTMTVEHTGTVEHVLSLKEKQEAIDSLRRIEEFAGEPIDVEAEDER